MANSTWREMLTEAGATEFVAVAPAESVLDVRFDPGFGYTEGPDFLAWTEDQVWFPTEYDGSEWVGSAPRNPRAEPQHHV